MLDVHPHSAEELARISARLNARPWALVRAGIPAWHPRLDGDDDDDSAAGKGGKGDDADRDDDADTDRDRDRGRGDRDRDRSRDRGRSDDDDQDDDDDDRSAAGFARLRRENAELKRKQTEAERKSREESGKFEELYSEQKNETDRLTGRVDELELDLEVVYIAIEEGATNPRRVVRLMRADGLLDNVDRAEAKRAVNRFKREEGDLFGRSTRRQSRSSSRDRDDDDRDTERDRDDDDDRDTDSDRRPRKRGRDEPFGPERLRAAFDERDRKGSNGRGSGSRDRDRDRGRR